jgi:type IV pilus assembly protein PilE
MRTHRGFTLIEVMVTVAIIAILAAVALPSYSAYVMRANVMDAAKGLSEMRLKMEQYFQDYRSWQPPAPAPQPCTAGSLAPLPANTERFTFACTALSANAYTVTATGVGSMAGFVYTINEANVQATTGAAAGWPTCATRWILKKSETCS